MKHKMINLFLVVVVMFLVCSCGSPETFSSSFLAIRTATQEAFEYYIEYPTIVDVLKNVDGNTIVYFNPQYGYYFIRENVSIWTQPMFGKTFEDTLGIFIPTTRDGSAISAKIAYGGEQFANGEGWKRIAYTQVNELLLKYFQSVNPAKTFWDSLKVNISKTVVTIFESGSNSLFTPAIFILPPNWEELMPVSTETIT